MSTHRNRILVVDDDPLMRSLIVGSLRKDSLVYVAADGSEGYYKALEHPPSLAIIDIQMPGWDGLKTLRTFRSHHALAKIPILILTSDASRETVVAAINSGANDYVIKSSFVREEFLKKVKKLLRNAEALAMSQASESRVASDSAGESTTSQESDHAPAGSSCQMARMGSSGVPGQESATTELTHGVHGASTSPQVPHAREFSPAGKTKQPAGSLAGLSSEALQGIIDDWE